MKYGKWAGRTAALAAALGLAATSSSAPAQSGPYTCGYIAWVICTYDENGRPWAQPTEECLDRETEACYAQGGTAQAKTPGAYDKRRSVQAA